MSRDVPLSVEETVKRYAAARKAGQYDSGKRSGGDRQRSYVEQRREYHADLLNRYEAGGHTLQSLANIEGVSREWMRKMIQAARMRRERERAE